MASLTENETGVFRSPQRKLVRFFQRSRDKWKRKCLEAKQRIKLLANQVRAVEKSREQWRARAEAANQRLQELEQQLAAQKENACPADASEADDHTLIMGKPQDWQQAPKGHPYSVGLIETFVDLVLSVPISLRGASGALQSILSRLWGSEVCIPRAQTGRLWVLRLGLHELTRPKEQAEDWVWIVDHTIQLGSTKCFLIVGCRLQPWSETPHPLQHRELHCLMLEPIEQSTGEVVERQLSRAIAITGVPRAILSDGGSDLKRGITLLRETHAEVLHIQDIVHRVAIFLKKILGQDERWQEFLQRVSRSKNSAAKTALAFLSPPAIPTHAR